MGIPRQRRVLVIMSATILINLNRALVLEILWNTVNN